MKSIVLSSKDDIAFMFQHNSDCHSFEFYNFIFGCLFPNYVPLKKWVLEIQYTNGINYSIPFMNRNKFDLM
jgi:hypothetical protein